MGFRFPSSTVAVGLTFISIWLLNFEYSLELVRQLPGGVWILYALLPLTLFLYTYIVEPLFLSPLRQIPTAHFTSPFTSAWISYYRRGGSQALPAITVAHARKGPIIRLGPNEISVADFEGAKKVYIERGGFAKPKWWAEGFMSYGVKNMVSMEGGYGSEDHAARKRDIGNVYAKSFLMGNESLKNATRKTLQSLRRALDGVIEEREGILDVYNFNGAVNADIASQYLFGESGNTKFLQNPSSRDAYYYNHNGWLKGKAYHSEAQKWLEAFGNQQCRSTVAEDAIVHKQLQSRGLEGNDLASEILDHFIAGAEAPRTTHTYIEWELSKRPAMQARLRKELQSLRNEELFFDFRRVDSLPLLDAILTETLRVYTPTPGPQHRLTPPEGMELHGLFIPGGVQISASLAVLHHNPIVFPKPDEWDPDRWLRANQAELDEMRRWYWPFNKGARICIGKDFTLIGKPHILLLD